MRRIRNLLAKIDPGRDGPPGRRELWILGGIVGVGVFVRLVYAVSLSAVPIAGDVPGFVHSANLFAEGKLFWGDIPYGIDHPTAWKAPGYNLWLGLIYTVIGPAVTKAALIQAVTLGPAVIALTWLLARRLFNRYIALTAAAVIAIYPNAFQWEEALYVESLILPLTLLFLIIALRGPPTTKTALGVGVLLGVMMLIRPSSFYLLAGLLAVWWVMSGFRPATVSVAIATVAMVLVVMPWTIRNAIVLDGFIPISVQDAAVAGTFNDDAANDEEFPYSWRPLAERDRDLFVRSNPLPEPELRSELTSRAREYIVDHPESIPNVIFWNGITRLWDIRRPSHVVNEARFEGRRRSVAAAGLAMYYVLAPMALFGLWRIRRSRRPLFALFLALVGAGILVFSIASTTRYRVPYEPLIVILASAGIVPALVPRARIDGGDADVPSPELDVSGPQQEPARS